MITFSRPEAWLLLLPTTLTLLLLARLGRGSGSPARRTTAFLLRLLVCACVIGALADPVIPRRVARPRRLVLLVDVSESARADARTRGLETLRAVRDADPEPALDALAFGGRTARIPWPLAADGLERRDLEPGGTDLAHALSAALAAAADGESLRVVLVTDGHETTGRADPVARTLRERGAVLDVHPLAAPTPGPTEPRARVLALDAPDEADAGAPVKLRAVVDPVRKPETKVVFRVNGRDVGEATADATGPDGRAAATLTLPSLPVGSHRLEAAVRGAPEADVIRALTVRPGPRARCLRDGGEPGAIEASLAASGIAVESIPPDAWRESLVTARPPDVLVLEAAGLRSTILASFPELIGALRRGVSLVITDALPLGDLRETPLAAVLPLVLDPPAPRPADPPEDDPPPGPGASVRTAEKEALRVALLIVVDTSGSMRGEKLAMARRAALQAAGALDDEDVLGVLGFADEPYVVVPFTPARARALIRDRLLRMFAQGGTDINLATKDGIAALRRSDFGIRHLILLSDGRTPPASFRSLVRGAAAEGITLSAIAIGHQADARLLSKLAEWGRGEFRWASKPADIPRLVTEDAVRILSEGRPDQPSPGASSDPAPEPEPTEPEPPPPAVLPAEPLRPAAPHPALAGIPAPDIPPLGGIVRGRARAAAWVALETERDGRPVLAEWRFGLGRVLTLAADLEDSGARDWRSWPELPRVWAQAVRALAASAAPSSAPRLEAILGPEEVRVRAGGRGNPVRLRDLSGDTPRSLETTPTPDGGVGVRFPRSDATGRRLIEARTEDGASRTLVIDVPARVRPEAAVSGTAEDRLRRLAAEAGGRYRPEVGAVPRGEEDEEEESVGWWLVVLGAGLLVVDVGVRRFA